MAASRISDPSAVPRVEGLAVGPAVSPARLTPGALRMRFATRIDWTPEMLDDRVQIAGAGTGEPRESAVLIALFNRGDDAVTVLMTVRNADLRTHAGQIAFPGGRIDPEDDGPIGAALREANEEVGLVGDDLEVLGALPSYRTATGYAITPVVALVDGVRADRRGLRVHEAEVADVFEVPLAFLMNPSNHERRRFQWAMDGQTLEREYYAMPWRGPAVSYRNVGHARGQGDYFIWGATAAIIRNLYGFLAAGEPSTRK